MALKVMESPEKQLASLISQINNKGDGSVCEGGMRTFGIMWKKNGANIYSALEWLVAGWIVLCFVGEFWFWPGCRRGHCCGGCRHGEYWTVYSRVPVDDGRSG